MDKLFNKIYNTFRKKDDSLYEGKTVYKTSDNLIEVKFLHKMPDERRTDFIKYLVKVSEDRPFILTRNLIESDMANVYIHRVAWHTFVENKAIKDLEHYLKHHDRELIWNVEKSYYIVRKATKK